MCLTWQFVMLAINQSTFLASEPFNSGETHLRSPIHKALLNMNHFFLLIGSALLICAEAATINDYLQLVYGYQNGFLDEVCGKIDKFCSIAMSLDSYRIKFNSYQ